MAEFPTIVPVLAEIELPWIIIAMIFISFLRFIMDRIRGTPEELEEPEGQEEFDPFDRQARSTEASERTTPPPLPDRGPAAELRQFLESLREPEPPAEPPEPPPAPRVEPTPETRPELSDKEKEAAAAFRERGMPRSRPYGASSSAVGVSPLSLLQSPDTLRQAIVLREVLGPPAALRDEDPEFRPS